MNDPNMMALMVMHTIGLSILFTEFKRASWAYFMPHYHPKTASDSLAFIQGTGLEFVVHAYGLQYDPENLRNTFYSMMGDHEHITNGKLHRVPSQGESCRQSPRYSADEQDGELLRD